MSAATIRMAGPDNVATLAELREEWRGERPDTKEPSFIETFRDWYDAEAKHRLFWLAHLDGRAVGMVNLILFARMPVPGRPSSGWGYLGNMYVRAEHRDAGIGSLLAETLLAHADRLGLERVVLNPTEQSIPFYRRHGFGPAGDLMLRPAPSKS